MVDWKDPKNIYWAVGIIGWILTGTACVIYIIVGIKLIALLNKLLL